MFPFLKVLRKRRRRKCLVLMFHRVASPATDRFSLSVSCEKFEELIAGVASVLRPISLQDFWEQSVAGGFKDDSFLVTFDDGYVDNLVNALPIVQRHGVPIVISIPTHFLGGRAFWWDAFDAMCCTVKDLSFEFGFETDRFSYSVQSKSVRLEQLARIQDEIYRMLRGESPRVTDEFTRSVFEGDAQRFSVTNNARCVSNAELSELQRCSLVTIASHTVFHKPLSTLGTDEIMAELVSSRASLRSALGVDVYAVAYPYGDYDHRVGEAARKAGYQIGFVASGGVFSEVEDSFRIPRYNVTNATTVRTLLDLFN